MEQYHPPDPTVFAEQPFNQELFKIWEDTATDHSTLFDVGSLDIYYQ